MSKNNNFRFWIPLDEISKSKDEQGNVVMKFGGLASTKRRDTDGETLDPAGFEIDYLKEKGIINWNHNKSPESVIGEPVKIERRKEGLYVESMLYPDNALAKSVFELAETLQKNSKTRRLGYSVEGKALERDFMDKSKVTKAMITNLALTISPKNPDSIVDIIKGEFNEFNDESIDVNKSFDDMLEEVDILKSVVNNKQQNGGKTTILDITKPDGTRIIVDSEYNVKIDKALDTVSGAPIIREHVDNGKDKIIEDEECKELTKSEIISTIFDKYPVISFDIAIDAYSKIKKYAMKSNTKITEDVLNKAIEELNFETSEDNISKSNDKENEMYGEDDDINDKDEENNETEDNKDEEEQENTKDDESVVKKSTAAGNSNQSVDNTASEVYNEITKSLDNLQGLQKNSFSNVGKILKSLHDIARETLVQNKNLSDEISELRTGLNKANDMIDDLSKQPVTTRRSIQTSRENVNNREFQKSVDDEMKPIQTQDTSNILSISKNKNKRVNLLDDMTFSKGFNPELSKALTTFESSSNLSADIAALIKKEKGITIVN